MFGLGKLKREFEVVKEAVEHLSWVNYFPTSKPVRTFNAHFCELSEETDGYQGDLIAIDIRDLQEQVNNLRKYLDVTIGRIDAVEASTKLVKKDNK